jgi:hypothetical protein
VFRAPAMILVNVVPHLCISNGTGGIMHSLTWASEAETEENLARIAKGLPGELVQVSRPQYVNIVIRSRHALPLPRVDPVTFDTLGPNPPPVPAGQEMSYLFPMQLWDCRERWVGKGASRRLELPACKSHMIELGFAFTFYKIQGATLEKLILDFNFPTAMECKFAAIYVGITRVRRKQDLFLLKLDPAKEAKVWTWMRKATLDKGLQAWLGARDEK